MTVIRPVMLTAFGRLKDAQGRILLLRRKNTGAEDGCYGMPGGRVEPGEDFLQGLTRELQEEIGCRVRAEDCELYALHQSMDGGQERLDAQFMVHAWEGEPKIMEPEKADAMGWFALDQLPNLGSITKRAIVANGLWVSR